MRRHLARALMALILVGFSVLIRGPAWSGGQDRIFILVHVNFVGFDLSRIDRMGIDCFLFHIEPDLSDPAHKGFGVASVGRSRFSSLQFLPGKPPDAIVESLKEGVLVEIFQEDDIGGVPGDKPRLGVARYFACELSYHCAGTQGDPRAALPGDPLLADPATACLGFDANRTNLYVSGKVPTDWD